MKSREEIDLMFARKRIRRDNGIDWLMKKAEDEGEPIARVQAAIRWDHQYAERTTNAQQLREIGIEPTPMESLNNDEVEDALEEVLYGLMVLGISIIGADQLSAKVLYRILTKEVLVEEVPDIPPETGMIECIDMSAHHARRTA